MSRATSPHPVLRKYYEREGDRHPFVTSLFDDTARWYDRTCDVGSFGTVRVYRRFVLRRAGVRPGMAVLDLATGTGCVATAAAAIVGTTGRVVGLDPSAGMLGEAARTFRGRLVQGRAESLPFADAQFDVVTLAYALRHMAELEVTFAECRRVLRPGGRLLLLEISRPRSAVLRGILRIHLRTVVPLIVRVMARGRVDTLLQYYWDTIAACVPPETIIDALERSGFEAVRRSVRGGVLSEYLAQRPAITTAEGHRPSAVRA